MFNTQISCRAFGDAGANLYLGIFKPDDARCFGDRISIACKNHFQIADFAYTFPAFDLSLISDRFIILLLYCWVDSCFSSTQTQKQNKLVSNTTFLLAFRFDGIVAFLLYELSFAFIFLECQQKHLKRKCGILLRIWMQSKQSVTQFLNYFKANNYIFFALRRHLLITNKIQNCIFISSFKLITLDNVGVYKKVLSTNSTV